MDNSQNIIRNAGQDAVQGSTIHAYEGRRPFIFVSYRHTDSDKVLPVMEKLRMREKPYRLWYDEGIAPGSEWPRNISEHLKRSEAVVCFISRDFQQSFNCENEVQNAIEQGKNIIVYSLDGTEHKGLSGYRSVSSAEELISLLPDKLIGTEEDYSRSGVRVLNGNIWNMLLLPVGVLIAVFILSTYGLLNGWFDKYLVSETEIPRIPINWTEVAYDEEEDIGEPVSVNIVKYDPDPMLEELFISQGMPIPWEKIEFKSEGSKRALYTALNLDDGYEMSYGDIIYSTEVTELEIDNASDEVIGLISRYPYLRKLYINSGNVTTLQPLTEAPNLRRVYISRSVLDNSKTNIPALRIGSSDTRKRGFRVYVIK